MTALNELRSRLQQDDYAFSETLAFVAEHYDYQPSAFRNGNVENAAGQNEGSCKTLGLALLEGSEPGRSPARLRRTLPQRAGHPARQRSRQHSRIAGARPGGRDVRALPLNPQGLKIRKGVTHL